MNKQQHQQLIDRLKELHLPMFREYHQEFAQVALANELGYEEYLDELAQRECEVRRANKINRLVKVSKLPLEKTLQTFEMKRLPLKIRRQVKVLCEGRFTERRENILAFGKPGSGKTHLLCGSRLPDGFAVLSIASPGCKPLLRYRDLLSRHKYLKVYTVGRSISPLQFNPFIPPPGCEPQIWIKLIVDVIAGSFLGGEGVISLLMSGLDQLYRQYGIYDNQPMAWPTVVDLLAWLRNTRLKGRAALWQASAERILLALTYGEFGKVLHTQTNHQIAELLDHHVVLELDGLSSNNDKSFFSEVLTLYLYRYRLAQGPQEKLKNMIILEEAHHLLLKKSSDTKESILESTIRQSRQYGLGYGIVDQTASMLSKTAYANTFATIALNQKLRSDIQTLSSAMNLTDTQRDALSTLPIGSAVVRLADEHPEAFMLKIPRSAVPEGAVSDSAIRERMAGYLSDSSLNKPSVGKQKAVSPVPIPDKNKEITGITSDKSHPPDSGQVKNKIPTISSLPPESPLKQLTREEIRFLADLITHPLSTTVSRYQRLHFSRRRGNAVRQHLQSAHVIEPICLPIRTGQVILYQLTPAGRTVCAAVDLDPGSLPRESLEHRYWVQKATRFFEQKGYDLTREHPVKGNGAIDLLATRPGEQIAIEVETGKSDVKTNLKNAQKAGVDRIIFLATSPAALNSCQKILDDKDSNIELMSWLDVS